MDTIGEWADILQISKTFILALIAIAIIWGAYELNPKAGVVLGILAIMAILANAKRGI